MKEIIHQAELTNGIRIELAHFGGNYSVKDYYPDGSRKDVRFFGSIESAGRFFNNIIDLDKENPQGDK